VIGAGTGTGSRGRVFAGLALGTIVVGLFVHLRWESLGPIMRDVLGDVLWAAMIAWAIGAVAPGVLLLRRSVAAYSACVVVEVSQLYHAPALDALRATRAGHLVLGSGFDARDLVAYAGGVATAAVLETILFPSVAGRSRP
jgi:hypothetical protein